MGTIGVKFQIAATNVLKLVALGRLSHVGFGSGFGIVFKAFIGVSPSRVTPEAPVPKAPLVLTPKAGQERADWFYASHLWIYQRLTALIWYFGPNPTLKP